VAHAPDEGGFRRSLSAVSATPLMLEDAEEGDAPPHPGAGESGVAPKRGGRLMMRSKSSYGAPASSVQGLRGCSGAGAPQAGILAWSTDDVCGWLVREGMECVAGAARERRIDGRDLIHFDKECWSELGVSAALDRARLMARLQEASKEAAAAEQAAAPSDRSQRGRAVGAAGAWACLTKTTFPRSHPVAVDHLKEWHDRIADSGRDPEEIRNIIKGHNDAYTLMFLLLFSAVLPMGFSLAPMFQITWTADGAPADGMSIYGIVFGFYFSLLAMVLFLCIMMPLPIGACIDACSKENLVLYLKGPGNRMITDLSACAVLVMIMCVAFLCLSFPLLLGRDAPWQYQLPIGLGGFITAGYVMGAHVGSTDDNSDAKKRIGIINGVREFLMNGKNVESHCRLVLHAGFVEEEPVPVQLQDQDGQDKTWNQIRDECALLALKNASLPTPHHDPSTPGAHAAHASPHRRQSPQRITAAIF